MNYLKKSFNREKPNMPVIIIFLAALVVDYDSPRYRAWPGIGEAGNDGKHIVEQNSGYWEQYSSHVGTAGSEYCARLETSKSLSWHGSGSIFGSVWCHHAGTGTE